MTSPKNVLLGFLLLSTLALGGMAWKQHLELVSLRANALLPRERADWQKRLWDSEKQRAELQAKVQARESRTESATADLADAPPPERPTSFRGGRPGFAAMMENPEIQRLFATQQKSGLDARYASLFKSLNLTPQQLDQFKNLLVEKSTAMMDVLAAARAQGINPRSDREAFQTLVNNAQADIDQNIRSAIGDTSFSEYQRYEQTLPQRAVLNQLEQRLSYSPTPLTPQQQDQMLQILASTAPAPNTGNAPRAMIAASVSGNAMFGGPHASVTEATVAQATGVLAGPQLDALKQIQQEQQAQAELNAAFRAQMQGNRGGPPPNATPAPHPGG